MVCESDSRRIEMSTRARRRGPVVVTVWGIFAKIAMVIGVALGLTYLWGYNVQDPSTEKWDKWKGTMTVDSGKVIHLVELACDSTINVEGVILISKVPAGCKLTITSNSGTILIKDNSGEVEIVSSDDTIQIEDNNGTATVKSNSDTVSIPTNTGTVSVAGNSDTIGVTTNNGTVSVAGNSDTISVGTNGSNGTVTVNGNDDTINVGVNSGTVNINGNSGGTLDDADINVGDNSSGIINVNDNGGSVNIGDNNGQHGTVNGSSGDIYYV